MLFFRYLALSFESEAKNKAMKKISILILITSLLSCRSQVTENSKSANQVSIATIAEQKIKESNIQHAIDWLAESKKLEAFVLNEAEINALGYQLLYNYNQPADALKIFELNVELFPSSANVYDSAGEGLFVNKDYQKSIAYYRKSMELSAKVQFHQLGYLPPKEYQATSLPKEVTQLFEQEGDWENDIAFVYVQGGPDLQLNIGPRDGLHLMPNDSSLLKIYPYQGQMLNPDLLACKPLLTEAQSAFENAQSVEILDKVIQYLVSQKKKVFLIGHSYGTSICMEYVHAKNNQAEKVVLMGLDLDEDISSWETLKSGEYIRWENGEKPYARVIFGNIPAEHPSKESFDRVADNLTMMVKSNMAKKYTTLYQAADFKNIISVYSTHDEANGRKSKEELAILKQQGTTVVEIEGDHHDMLTSEFMTALYEHLVNGEPLGKRY